MSEPVVAVQGLSKSYLISHERREQYVALRDVLMNGLRNLGRRIVRAAKAPGGEHRGPAVEEYWALKDVSFEIAAGDVVGIIGRNGAGKSTLLKILSRITEPTEGRITLCGRVASLLEVGTGFHPELTGRENIYLNGAILGMGMREIAAKFDEIVHFSEIEKFLDTPVKRYSSGMYVRLAFAVAAHLEPDILVVDEVLAVGDSAFQQKCLGKMRDVSAKENRTVLFVSHNMGAINALCNRAILLQDGRITADESNPQKVIQKYNNSYNSSPGRKPLYGDEDVLSLESVRVRQADEANNCRIDEDIFVEVVYTVKRSLQQVSPNINLFDEFMNFILCTHQIRPLDGEKDQTYLSTCRIPRNLLKEGIYYIDFALGTPDPSQTHVYYKHVLCFGVVETWTGDTARGRLKVPVPGIVSPLLEWHTETTG